MGPSLVFLFREYHITIKLRKAVFKPETYSIQGNILHYLINTIPFLQITGETL